MRDREMEECPQCLKLNLWCRCYTTKPLARTAGDESRPVPDTRVPVGLFAATTPSAPRTDASSGSEDKAGGGSFAHTHALAPEAIPVSSEPRFGLEWWLRKRLEINRQTDPAINVDCLMRYFL